jgi:hypothetical protein
MLEDRLGSEQRRIAAHLVSAWKALSPTEQAVILGPPPGSDVSALVRGWISESHDLAVTRLATGQRSGGGLGEADGTAADAGPERDWRR